MKKLGISKSLIIMLVILLFAAQGAYATVLVDENWDSGTPPSGWPCKNAPTGPCNPNLSFRGWTAPVADSCNTSNNDFWALTGLTAAQAHSGSKSFLMNRVYKSSDNGTCDVQFALSSPYPTKIYLRFWVYFTSQWANFNTPTSREPYFHFFFTNSAFSMTAFRVNLLSKVPYTSPHACGAGENYPNQPYMWFNCQNNSTDCAVGAPAGCYNLLDHLNQWQCVEFMMDATNKKYNIWVGGNKLVDNITVPMSQSNFTMVQFSQFNSGIDGTAFNSDYYLDDIVISDSGPIGCGVIPSSPILN